jgi:glyoxylase-like metal-dependent hydrolase (beta-lactamase superfamily II)/rhodanese-related sulfurtransferase
VDVEIVVTPGLGDNSYLLTSGDEAAMVDPQRDVGRFLSAAKAKGATIRHVLETHVHNDYLSGALELAEATGAEIVAPAAGRYEFPHHAVSEGDEIALGDTRITALETPGHTPEHTSYLATEAATPRAVFTGGSLMVGGAGRTDLLGEELTDGLTRSQYRTLQRLGQLPDEVEVLPTHGAGSFCGVGEAPAERTSTMGQERQRNGALRAPDEDTFVKEQLTGLGAYPTYYGFMAPINRHGPRLLREVPLPAALTADEAAARIDAGATVVDGRWRVAFARAHVPGSLNVELQDDFASYVGWVVPFGDPIVLVLPQPEEESLTEAITQLLRVGYERLEGYLAGGAEAWLASGRPVGSYGVAGLKELCEGYRSGKVQRILDVRQRNEWESESIPGSQNVFVGDLPQHLGQVAGEGEVWAICRSGHRSAMAASLLDAAAIPVRLVDGTGVPDFLRHCPPDDELRTVG